MTRRHVQVISHPAVAGGFALAGLVPVEAETADEAAARVAELLADDATGVILVEDRCYDALPDTLRAQIGRRPVPLVVPFPGPAWVERPGAAESYIVELLRQVIGYRVRLR
jgi:vacuolar-type H+-ATPase subunit F/Vma7